MKKALLITATVGILFASCKKETISKNTNSSTAATSKMSLLRNEWVLSETFVDGVQKTSNGTGLYKFENDGTFKFYNTAQSSWSQIGTYWFNGADSNSVSVLLSGMSMSYWWDIKKLDKNNLHTEFIVQGKKNNYNYTRQ